MPVVNISWAEGRTNAQKQEVIEQVTDVISKVCEIDSNRVTILINDIPKTNVGLGGIVHANINFEEEK